MVHSNIYCIIYSYHELMRNKFYICIIVYSTQFLFIFRFAGNKCVIRNVADLFDMSLSTAYLIIIRVINFLCDIAPSIIKFPQTAEKRETNAIQFKEV